MVGDVTITAPDGLTVTNTNVVGLSRIEGSTRLMVRVAVDVTTTTGISMNGDVDVLTVDSVVVSVLVVSVVLVGSVVVVSVVVEVVVGDGSTAAIRDTSVLVTAPSGAVNSRLMVLELSVFPVAAPAAAAPLDRTVGSTQRSIGPVPVQEILGPLLSHAQSVTRLLSGSTTAARSI